MILYCWCQIDVGTKKALEGIGGLLHTLNSQLLNSTGPTMAYFGLVEFVDQTDPVPLEPVAFVVHEQRT